MCLYHGFRYYISNVIAACPCVHLLHTNFSMHLLYAYDINFYFSHLSCIHYIVLHVISYITIYASACFNPIIYVIMNKQYRKAYKSVLQFGCCETAKERVPVLRTISKRLHPHGNNNHVAC